MGGLRGLFAAALGAMLLAGVAAGQERPRPSGGTLRILDSQGVERLDPSLVVGRVGHQLVWAMCEPLMGVVPAARRSDRLAPRAAAGFPRVSRDGRSYTFTIRRGIRFSDGSAVTAAAYAASIGRTRKLRPPDDNMFSDVASVRGRGRTLQILLTRPNADLLARLTTIGGCPVPPGMPADPTGIDLPAASGPYRLVSHEPRRSVVLERNPYYRGPRPRLPARIALVVRGDRQTNVRAVEAGEADYTNEIPRDLVPDLVRRHGLESGRLGRFAGDQVAFLALNMRSPLFRDNPRLRRAVNLALDRREIVRQTGEPLHWRRTDQLVTPASVGFVDHDLYPLDGPDLRLARRLARGNLRGGRAVLYTRPSPFWARITDAIRYNLAQIGLDVSIRTFATPVLAERVGTPGEPYDLVQSFWIGVYPDPTDILVPVLAARYAALPKGNSNWAYFQHPGYDRRLAAAGRLTGAERLHALAALEADVLRNEAPYAPLFYSTDYALLSPRVGCITPAWRRELGSLCLRG